MSNLNPIRRVLVLATLSIGLLAGTLAVPAGAEDNLFDGNSCTQQQIEGGYEDWFGDCVLTGWNWEFGDLCPGQRGADVGRYGGGSCLPDGCVTPTCDVGDGGGGGGGGGSVPTPCQSPEDCWTDEEGGYFDIDSLQEFVDTCIRLGGTFDGEIVEDGAAFCTFGDDLTELYTCERDQPDEEWYCHHGDVYSTLPGTVPGTWAELPNQKQYDADADPVPTSADTLPAAEQANFADDDLASTPAEPDATTEVGLIPANDAPLLTVTSPTRMAEVPSELYQAVGNVVALIARVARMALALS